MQNGNSKSQAPAKSQTSQITKLSDSENIKCLVKGKEAETCNHWGCRFAATNKHGWITREYHLKEELNITHLQLFKSNISGATFVRPIDARKNKSYQGFDMEVKGEWPADRQIFPIEEVAFEHHEYTTWTDIRMAEMVSTTERGMQYCVVDSVETTDIKEVAVYKARRAN